jgi:3-mercaptopyruvate sulfurtransferase SseA
MMALLNVVKHECFGYGNVRHHIGVRRMATDAEWQALVKGMLKAEMKRRNMPYEQLAQKLAELGAQNSSAQVLRTKVSRGGFSAVFFVQCLKAMGCQQIILD